MESRGWKTGAEVRAEIDASGGTLTEDDYLKCVHCEHPHLSWWKLDAGIRTSSEKVHLHMGDPISLWKTNVVFRGEKDETPIFAYRDSSVKSRDTKYYVLDPGAVIMHVLEATDILTTPFDCFTNNREGRPKEWFKGRKNQVLQAYATVLKFQNQRVYAVPHLDFEAHLEGLNRMGRLDWEVLNSLNGERKVDFIYEGPSNATMLHPITGNAPSWHTLAGEGPNKIYDARTVKQLLNRR